MLLSNPLSYPMLPRLGLTLAGVFASSLVALLVAKGSQWQALQASVLFQRWRTWLLIAPLFSLVVLAGVLPVAIFAATLALQGGREYARLAGLQRIDRSVLYGLAACVPLAAAVVPTHLIGPGLLLLLLVSTLPALLDQDLEHGVERSTRLAFGLWYVPANLCLLVLLERDPAAGPGLLLALGLSVALSDVGAFTLGRLLGRRPLAPRLSPSKTWAGVLGSIIGAALGLRALAQFAPLAPLLALVPAVALGAIWGDLLESLLKRAAKTKDTGNWLPGFGGLLDRIDSLLIVLPLVYLVLEVAR
jgi:phosphatidate cytidylyltransferase